MRTKERIIGAACAAVVVIACSSTLSTSNTSLVTVSLGRSGSAVLVAQPLTVLQQVRRFLAAHPLVSNAYAYIPSIMRRVRITVSAADLPPTAVTEESSLKVFADITIEVPNGRGRRFLVEGLDAAGVAAFRGEATADLTGAEIALDMALSYVGTGIYVDSVSGSDAGGDGSAVNPYQSIAYVLRFLAGNERIIVRPGTYDIVLSPLQLNPGTQLICTDPALTIITSTATAAIPPALIFGNEGASVDLCRLQVPVGASGINDTVLSTSTPARTIINSVSIGSGATGVVLAADSSVLGSSIVQSSSQGILVLGGRPAVFGNDIFGNATGVTIQDGRPTIRENVVHGNSTGISVGPASTAVPSISDNSLYCNVSVDLRSESPNAVDVRNNAWDRDMTTTPSGPTILLFNDCVAGSDICYSSIPPLFEPFRRAVPNGCP